MSVSSQTEIYNKAVMLLGSQETIGRHEDGGLAQSLTKFWNLSRRAALMLHPWNFAINRQILQRDPDNAPPFGYANAFELPANCLRWLPWDEGSRYFFEGEEESGFLLSDEESIHVRFIWDNEKVAAWSALFCQVMAYQLAFEFCEGKTQLRGLRNELRIDRDELLIEAKSADGLATGNRRRPNVRVRSRWAGARNRPMGLMD